LEHEDHPQFAPDRIRKHVGAILASAAFAHSGRMSRFLRFVVDRALDGAANGLKEYSIGVEVFDRKPSYDPRVDPIVRVEARRLRSKLAAFYEAEGKGSDIQIVLPKGCYAPRFERPGTTEAAHQEPLTNEPPERTIAVLPFANVSRDPDKEYFSDGLTEELIHALTKVEGLRVVAWSSATRVRGDEPDVYAIGQQLGVATVLKGSVRCYRDRLRILAQLIDTRTGYYLWSETYDRHMEEMFAIQEEIAASIVRALQVKLGVQKPRAHNVHAYHEYLQGRYHWNKRSAGGLRKSLEHFKRAVEIDPDFALGHSGMSDAYVLMADYGVESAGEAIPKGRAAAMRALSIDPTLGEAEATLGFIRALYDWEWDAGGEHFQRAMRMNPSYATAFHWYGLDYCAVRGRMREALDAITTAIELDPLSSIIREGKGYIYLLARDYDAALGEYRKLLDFDQFFYKAYNAIGRVYCQMGRYDEAIEMLETGRRLCGDAANILGALGQSYGLAGHEDKAKSILNELDAMSRRRHTQATCFALVHLGLGNKECALQWLERGYGQRDISMAGLGVHPAYDRLRSEPRFKALLEKIGLST
jgi:TolB-like protein/Flp pilus assembly protein TadD